MLVKKCRTQSCRRPFINTQWLATALALSFAVASAPLKAGYFDCSVIYDEYESLMNRQFLIEPAKYVGVISDEITREQFKQFQQGRLRLNIERSNLGVAVFQTNLNTRGKLLFDWDADLINQRAPLKIIDGVLYGRVLDGYGPRKMRPILLKSSYLIDLDSGNIRNPEETADLAYVEEDGVYRIEAINGASIDFPTESMCHEITAVDAPVNELEQETGRLQLEEVVIPESEPILEPQMVRPVESDSANQ